jgi:cytochrome b subunit of formate dehydrogenase/5-methylcytosine-specific restriction endonuclease McrA
MRGIVTMHGLRRPIRIAATVLCFALAGPAAAQAPAPQPAPAPAPAPEPAPAQAPAAQGPITAETCLGCHGFEGFTVPDDKGGTRNLHIDKDKFVQSVHGTRNCVDCHQQITEVPHQKIDRIQVSCVSCHTSLWEEAKIEGKTKENAKLGTVVQMIDRYMKSVHARPNMVDQSRTNATCYNCHDPHYVYPKGSPIREEWRRSLPARCGNCHDSEFQLYKTSVHGREVLEKHNPKAATCSDCHSTHDIDSPQLDQIKLNITQNCGGCHKENLDSYLETYHGQVNKLGYTYTAKCFDCHGSHAIERVSNPSSRVHPDNLLTTCQQCHANATKGFTTFQPHANTHDFARYPYTWLASKFMLALLGGTLSFFWLHSALWYYRELREHQEHKNIPHVRAEAISESKPGVYFNRWPWGWRLAHLLFAICVIMLVFTGMTLFYADSFWAPLVQYVFGGPTVTGRVHRFFGVCFVAIFFLHLIYVAMRIAPNWRTFQWFGPFSFIPNLKDLEDAIGMFKWFFGMGPRPRFDRWSYWEKFDYWAPFWGVTIIGVSGAMLWAKEFVAAILPGWVFNVAMIFHAEEAVLAAGFLFTVHFFNNHWRPENFPLDILMFTGKMPLEKFRREHPLDYDRLVAAGELESHLVEAPSRPLTIGSKILGFALMAIGLILLVLILVGFARRLMGG